MVDPLPTNYADGQTVLASHVNAIGEVVNELRRDVNGFLPSGEVVLQSSDAGPLSERPDPVGLLDGTLYTATDELVTYVVHADDWVKISTEAGKILASANPTTAAALATTNGATYYRVPELTTASFVMPSNTCTVSLSPLKVTNVSVAGTLLQIRYTTDAWVTSKILWGVTELNFVSNTSVFPAITCRLAEVGTLTAPTPGASVQVAVFLNHPSDTSITPGILHAFSLVCLLEVRAG
jgi:hypothetical protein